MSDVARNFAALGAGILLGSVYFLGLWWTIRHGLTAANPALWFGGSALVRMIALLAAFYYIVSGGWLSLIAGMLGFVFARLAITRICTRPAS